MAIIPPEKLAIEDYHKAAWLTHSKLQTFDRGGPRLYYLAHVQQLWPARPDSDALRFGKAIEMLAFHPKQFDATYTLKPKDLHLGKGARERSKQWHEEHANHEILDESEVAKMHEMVAALQENEAAMALLEACSEQVTYSTTWQANNGMRLDVASRMDFSSVKGCAVTGFAPFLADLKSTDRIVRFRSGNVAADYGYHSQMALGQWCMEQNLPDLPPPRGIQIVIEKQLPHRCEIFEFDAEALDVGFAWCTQQVDLIATHHAANAWPRVNTAIQTLSIPRWQARQWEELPPE